MLHNRGILHIGALFLAVNGNCSFKKTAVGAKVAKVMNITYLDEEGIVDAVAFHGPVSIAYQVQHPARSPLLCLILFQIRETNAPNFTSFDSHKRHYFDYTGGQGDVCFIPGCLQSMHGLGPREMDTWKWAIHFRL